VKIHLEIHFLPKFSSLAIFCYILFKLYVYLNNIMFIIMKIFKSCVLSNQRGKKSGSICCVFSFNCLSK